MASHSTRDEAAHIGMYVLDHVIKTDTGRQVTAAVAGTALAAGKVALAAAAAAPLLPLAAVGGAAYLAYRLATDDE